jgi:hypothetical protein
MRVAAKALMHWAAPTSERLRTVEGRRCKRLPCLRGGYASKELGEVEYPEENQEKRKGRKPECMESIGADQNSRRSGMFHRSPAV